MSHTPLITFCLSRDPIGRWGSVARSLFVFLLLLLNFITCCCAAGWNNMAEGFSKIPTTTPLLQENLKELLDILSTADENVNRTGRTERDPLIPRNETTIHVDNSDDEFEDIIQGERIPIAVHHDRRSVTNAGTFFHLLKAYFSPALLTMPKAMSHLGLVPGIIGIFIFGTLFTYCIHVLLEVNKAIVNRVTLDRKKREKEDELLRLQRLRVLQQLVSITNATVNSVLEDNCRKDTSNGNQNSVPKDNCENDTSTTGNQETKKMKKNTKNWKLRFAPDFERGEPSSSKEPNESLISSYETVPEDSADPPNDNSDSNKSDEIPQVEQHKDNNEQHQNIQAELPPVRTLHYPKLVELSFHYGMKENKWAAKPMTLSVQLLMYLTHYGCCCVCFLFTAESLGELATKGPFTHSGSFEMVSYAIPFVICISFLPTGHEMTAVNTIAFSLQFCGVCMMGYYFFIGEHADHTELNLYSAPVGTWYLYFGLIFYAFEGTGVSLHVESHMARKQDFLGWKGILSRSMYITIPVYAIVGGLGYWKYGNDVHTSVSFNLPEEHIPDLIQILIGMGVLLTYPFHLSFMLNPLKKLLLDDSLTGTSYQIFDVLLRAVFVVSTYVVSALVPFLELQLTVIGATASSFLVLFMPAFMSLNSYIHLPDLDYGPCRLAFHCLLMIIGSAGAGLGTYMNFKNAHLYYPNSTIFG